MTGKPVRSPVYVCLGLVAFLFAALVSNPRIEQALGRDPGSLAWGPALFRTVREYTVACSWPGANDAQQGEPILQAPSIAAGTVWLLTGLSVIAILLRIPNLNSSLWLDEVLTMTRFVKPPFLYILTSFPGPESTHVVFGDGACVLAPVRRACVERALPSVLFGAGSLWALFLLGRKY